MKKIKAYNYEYGKTWLQKKKYERETVIAKSPRNIIKCFGNYVENNECDNKVLDFLSCIICDKTLLDKVRIVSYGSFRSICYLIRPDKVTYTGNYYDKEAPKDPIQSIFYFRDKADIIFINIGKP